MKTNFINRTSVFEKLMVVTGVGVGVFILFFLLISTWIGYDVNQRCTGAVQRYEGTCVEALQKLVSDETQPFAERNSAIWALGQLGDTSALPALEKIYTGDIPAREPWNGVLSQYELKKAIKLLNGGFNMTAFVWRR